MRRQNWFYRQLFSYVPAFFIVISFIFFVFFQLLGDQSRKEALKANETLMLQAMSSIDASLKMIEQSLWSEMLKKPDLFQFYNTGTPDNYYLNVKIVKFMNDFLNTNPLVNSIYLVRTRDNYILSNATSSTMEDYPDSEFIESFLHQQKTNNAWSGVRPFEEFSVKGPSQVVSLALKVPFLKSGQGFLVVNVSTDALNQSVASMYSPNISYIRVVDATGGDIIPALTTDQSRSSASSAISPVTGWSYQSGLVQGKWVNVASQLYNIWFVLGIVMIVAGGIWIVYMARRNYKPIESIVAQVQKFSETKVAPPMQGGGQDEFTFIQSAISQMLERSNDVERQSREDLHVKNAYLFHQIMEGRYFPKMEEQLVLRDRMQLNDLSLPQLVCVIEIDRFALFCKQLSRGDQSLIKFALRCSIQDTAQEHGVVIWTEWISNKGLGILVQLDDVLTTRELLTDMLDQAKRWIEAHLKLTVTIGVGGTAMNITEIPTSYMQAQQALNYKLALGMNQVISYDQLTEEHTGTMFDYIQPIHSLAQQLRLGKADWRSTYMDFTQRLGQMLLPRDQIISLMDYLIYFIGREMDKMTREYQELWERVEQQRLKETLQHAETYVQIIENVEAQLEQLYTEIVHIRLQRNHAEIIHQIREFLDDQYANPNVSLDFLSDRFHIPAKLLSKLFKEEIGQKFVDYLIELRMRHAQVLLVETCYSIQEIAELVGYLNVISFGRMFKKMVNLSPSEYRDQHTQAKKIEL